MPAQKGNRYAAKDTPKTKYVGLRFRPDAAQKLKNIALQEKLSMTQIVEKALLKAYPKEFDGIF